MSSNRKPPPAGNKKKPQKISKQRRRVHPLAFKLAACKRIAAGVSIRQLSEELAVKRTILYRWRDQYRQHGVDGLRLPAGRPAKSAAQRQAEIEASKDLKIASLERLVGQQEVDLRFLRLASKRLEESTQHNAKAGETASTERSRK